MVRVNEGESVKEYVVSKSKYAEATDGLSVQKRFPISYSSFDKAEIVQTTSSGESKESCKVAGNYNAETEMYDMFDEATVSSFKEGTKNSFVNSYKAGQYQVPHVFVNDEKVDLNARNQRFVYTDTHYMEDYAGQTNQARAMVNGKFKFGKAMKGDLKDWGKHYVTALGVMAGMGLCET